MILLFYVHDFHILPSRNMLGNLKHLLIFSNLRALNHMQIQADWFDSHTMIVKLLQGWESSITQGMGVRAGRNFPLLATRVQLLLLSSLLYDK